MSASITLPEKPRGRPPQSYYDQLDQFAADLKAVASTLDFKMSARGWGYYLEGEGQITKSQLDYAEKKINDLRKSGKLPLDFTAKDTSRLFQCGGGRKGHASVDAYIKSSLERLSEPAYKVPFWDTQDCYIQVLVEKVDLVELFRPVCEDYYIPIATAKGWSSLNQRGRIAANFHIRQKAGNDPVLLYCGDFDPPGVRISDTLWSNLMDLAETKIPVGDDRYLSGWMPIDIDIERIGLNRTYIEDNNLRWVNNLETGSGRNLASPTHSDHDKEYVQRWLSDVGERKVEANALLKNPDAARSWFRSCVEDYLGDDPTREYHRQLLAERKEVKTRLSELGVSDAVDAALDELDDDDDEGGDGR